MFPNLLIAKVIKWAAKGILSEKLMKKVVIALGDLLVKSTKNKLDDKLWAKLKKTLKS